MVIGNNMSLSIDNKSRPETFLTEVICRPIVSLGSEKVFKGVTLIKGILATGEGGMSSKGVTEEMTEDPAASLYCFDCLNVYDTGTGFLSEFRKVPRYHDWQIGTF